MEQGANQLGTEVSPYLLQHAHNPIWWFPWGDKAFAEAERLDIPVFLSIGYSTCYWCHVMEKECFEHVSVAEALNGKFVSIKVDREERPDVDQIYMDALVGMTGHGGWPMSVFLTPDRRPFWAGTYIPREQFLPLLREVSSRWHSDREKIEAAAERVTDAIQFESREVSTTGVKPLETAEQAVRESLARYDTKWGGFGGAPKFPSAQLLQLFTHVYHIQGGDDTRAALEHTLERMAAGGIYDHIGGGFSRYSVDAEWRVPHFEKMLYDNALLALTYLKAGQVLSRDDLLEVARETLDYLERDMRSSETGAYYAAEDAGAVGSEGEFYLWQHDELKSALSTEEFLALSQRFEILPKGNFEGRIVFFLKQFSPWKSRFPGQSLETLQKYRSYRDRPHRDTKILIGWNGLALRAFVEASFIFQSSKYRDLAVALGSFLVEIGENNELCTSYAGAVRRGGIGCLEDYAFVIAGLIDLFELTGSAQWLLQAYHYQRKQDEHFWSEQEGLYRYSVAPDLIVERYPLFDSPTPNGNGVSFSNLYRLSLYFWDEELRLRSERLQRGFQRVFEQVPSAVPTAVMGALGIERGKELVIVAPERKRQEVVDAFAPYRPQLSLFAVLSPEDDYSDIPALRGMSVQHEDDEIFYLCEQGRCLTPSRDRGEMKGKLLEDKS